MVSHFYFWMLVIIYYLIFSPFHFWFWCWYKCDSCLKLVDVWGWVGMQKCQYYPPTTGTPDALRNSTKKEWKLVFSNFHFQILPKSGKTCFPISFSSHCIDICWNSAESKNNSNYTSQFILPVFRIFLQKAFILLFILNYCIPTDINVMFQKKNTWNYTIYGWTIKRLVMNRLSKYGDGATSKV